MFKRFETEERPYQSPRKQVISAEAYDVELPYGPHHYLMRFSKKSYIKNTL